MSRRAAGATVLATMLTMALWVGAGVTVGFRVGADAAEPAVSRKYSIAIGSYSRQWPSESITGCDSRWRMRWLAVVMLLAVFFHIAIAMKFGDLWMFGGND